MSYKEPCPHEDAAIRRRGAETCTPTRRQSPALPGGWSQSHRAARRAWHGAPLSKFIEHMLTVCLMLFHVTVICVRTMFQKKEHADSPRLGLRGDSVGAEQQNWRAS